MNKSYFKGINRIKVVIYYNNINKLLKVQMKRKMKRKMLNNFNFKINLIINNPKIINKFLKK